MGQKHYTITVNLGSMTMDGGSHASEAMAIHHAKRLINDGFQKTIVTMVEENHIAIFKQEDRN